MTRVEFVIIKIIRSKAQNWSQITTWNFGIDEDEITNECNNNLKLYKYSQLGVRILAQNVCVRNVCWLPQTICFIMIPFSISIHLIRNVFFSLCCLLSENCALDEGISDDGSTQVITLDSKNWPELISNFLANETDVEQLTFQIKSRRKIILIA